MASPETRASTSNTCGGLYEVSLNFTGLDTCHTFTNSLYHALLHAGFRVFIDDEELQFGEKISDNLPQAIDNSKIYMPIFSVRYASSHRCLNELARMVENTSKSKEEGKKVILPIFYDVKPNDVKLKTELYKKDISNLEQQLEGQKNKFSSENIKTWRQALKAVGGIRGWELTKYRSYTEVIEKIVDEVEALLQTREIKVPKDLVGMEDQIVAIEKLLDIDSDGVRLIGIYGMGGIGKTTLAKRIFNKLCHYFGRNCSFLDNVRETAKNNFVKLQEKLLSNISYIRVAPDIPNIGRGIRLIEEAICNKKVLIVLDDVDEANQIQNLIGENLLYSGTRILVTTRDKSILNNIRGLKYTFEEYEMVRLSKENALKLFSRHAFEDDSPPPHYYTLSEKIVSTAYGLPLALAAIGSSLFGEKDREIWEEWLEKLKKTPHDDIWKKLKISYDALDKYQQQIFLDIACFFVGREKTNAMYVWKDCGFSPRIAIKVLTRRCMMFLDDDRFGMHDEFRDLGRAIAKEERTRLWDKDDIICELRSIEIKGSVQALRLGANDETINSEQIKRFPRIQFLWLSGVICQGDFTGCLSKLKWISLDYGYCVPDDDLPRRNQCLEATNLLHLENAVVVNLRGIDIIEDVFESLIKGARMKVLTIEYNKSIRKLSTFPEYSVLEKLDINKSRLMKIDCSIGKLKCLTDLSIQSIKLRKLPKQIGELENLQYLSLRSCINLIKLPDSVLKLKLLTRLDVSLTKITRLPDSIGRLSSLSFADVTFTPIKKLPSTMSKFRQLKTLNLRLCDRIQELPKLPRSLTTLQVTSTSLLTVPNLSYLSELVELYLSDGSEHRRRSDIIPTCDLGWIGKLSKLSKLRFCFPSVCAPTIELGSLSQLKELTLHGLDLPTFEQLPSNLIVLKLYETREKQEHLDGLPPLRKSRENKVCEQHDVQFPDVLESSERSSIQDCRSSKRLVCRPEEPRCNEQQAPKLIDHQREAFLFPSSLNMLIECCLSGFPEVQDIRFVSPLESLEKFSVKECSSLKSLGGLSSLKNLKQLEIDQCPSLKVVEGIDELEFLCWLEIGGCRSLERIFDASSSKIRKSSKSMVCHPEEPGKSELQAPELTDHWREAILFPSSQKMLRRFTLSGSHEVQDIQFDSTFVSLEEISIRECSSLKRLGGLSNLKNLKQLDIDQCSSLERLGSLSNLKNLQIKIDQCPSLQDIEGIYELKSSCSLEISGCIFERIFDVLSSKEPDNCEIHIPREKSSDDSEDDSELGYTEYFDTWESYREKILSRTKQVPGSEIETTNSETETGDPLQKTSMKKTKDEVRQQAADMETSDRNYAIAAVQNVVGIDDPVKQITDLLDMEVNDEVCFIGIYGTDGIGKTTLAKAVYNRISSCFDSCSFLTEVEETTQNPNGIQVLQTKLIRNILERDREDPTFDERIEDFLDIFRELKVLIVIDDVEKQSHLHAIVGDQPRFGLGSRIIVTSQNEEILEGYDPEKARTYMVGKLDDDQALELFCQHAFGKKSPMPGYRGHANCFVNSTEKLPLAIEVIGSFLRGKSIGEWKKMEESIKKLMSSSEKTTACFAEILNICYEGLDPKQKHIFLDIACFISGVDARIASYMWPSSNLPSSHCILMPLAKIGENNELQMHRLLRCAGQRILNQKGFGDPTRRKFYTPDMVSKAISKEKGMENVEAVCIDLDDNDSCEFTAGDFESLPDKTFLKLDNAKVFGDFTGAFPSVKWLRWQRCPPDFDAENFVLRELVILDLSWSKVTEDWRGWSEIKMEKLKVLNLTGCSDLLFTPDFSGYKYLEILILERCSHLVKLDPSISHLKRLVSLNLKFCSQLNGLPVELGCMTALKELSIDGTSVRQIPISIGNLKDLEILSGFKCFQLTYLPSSISYLAALSKLSLDGAKINELPSSLGELLNLRLLSLRDCRYVEELPDSIGKMRSLEELDISVTSISNFPDSIRNLQSLKVLRMDSTFIRAFPGEIGNLTKLEELHASWCRSLKGAIPSDIRGLRHLRSLTLGHSSISSLPPEISTIYGLHILDLLHCNEIEELPKLPPSLVCLHVSSERMKAIPLLEDLKELEELCLSDGDPKARRSPSKQPMPESNINRMIDSQSFSISFPKLRKLELSLSQVIKLKFEVTDMPPFKRLKTLSLPGSSRKEVSELPETLSVFKLCHSAIEEIEGLEGLEALKRLDISNCKIQNLNGLGRLTSLRSLILSDCDYLSLPDLSKLKSLKVLEIRRCKMIRQIKGLEKLTSLEKLDISECPAENSVQVQKALKHEFESTDSETETRDPLQKTVRLLSNNRISLFLLLYLLSISALFL